MNTEQSSPNKENINIQLDLILAWSKLITASLLEEKIKESVAIIKGELGR